MEKVPPAPPAAAAPRPCGAGARARRMRTPQHFPGAGEVSTLGFRGRGPSRRAVGPPRLQRERSGVHPDFETLVGTAGGGMSRGPPHAFLRVHVAGDGPRWVPPDGAGAGDLL